MAISVSSSVQFVFSVRMAAFVTIGCSVHIDISRDLPLLAVGNAVERICMGVTTRHFGDLVTSFNARLSGVVVILCICLWDLIFDIER
jgi:hypothetical protein